MGTRMMGLAPRPPFFSGQMWLGAHFWALSVFLKSFLRFFCAGHLWLGARLLGSLVYFFVLVFLFSFLFSFFSVSASWIPPLGYEIILFYSIESFFWQVRNPYSAKTSLWGSTQHYSFGSERLCENDPLFQGRGDYFCKGVLLVCPPSQV